MREFAPSMHVVLPFVTPCPTWGADPLREQPAFFVDSVPTTKPSDTSNKVRHNMCPQPLPTPQRHSCLCGNDVCMVVGWFSYW
jgi:hypothetical protein